ncbi:hypothetical protein SNE40_015684 [Patella caerulea]|uniref:C-type lectin domain-containing protein n=1 Tax=Patella caerulea TaxID=87958 RepID=A0AAN8JHH9_PATCE
MEIVHLLGVCVFIIPRVDALLWHYLSLDNYLLDNFNVNVTTSSKLRCAGLASTDTSVQGFAFNTLAKLCYLYSYQPTQSSPTTQYFASPVMKTFYRTIPAQPEVECTNTGYEWCPDCNGCFRVYTSHLPVAVANQTCIDDGGYLIRLTSSATKTWLTSKMLSLSVDKVWVGAQEINHGLFLWDSGDEIDDALWYRKPSVNDVSDNKDFVTYDPYFKSILNKIPTQMYVSTACELNMV